MMNDTIDRHMNSDCVDDLPVSKAAREAFYKLHSFLIEGFEQQWLAGIWGRALLIDFSKASDEHMDRAIALASLGFVAIDGSIVRFADYFKTGLSPTLGILGMNDLLICPEENIPAQLNRCQDLRACRAILGKAPKLGGLKDEFLLSRARQLLESTNDQNIQQPVFESKLGLPAKVERVSALGKKTASIIKGLFTKPGVDLSLDVMPSNVTFIDSAKNGSGNQTRH